MNGDIKGAVSLLNKCDKKQMALRVVSCFNNPLYQQSMREEAKKLKHFTEGAKSMVDYIIG